MKKFKLTKLQVLKVADSSCCNSRSLTSLPICLENHGNFGKILIKSGRDFCKSKLQRSNFKILGAPDVFDIVESISTIKNMIQTILLRDFLNFFWPDSCHF